MVPSPIYYEHFLKTKAKCSFPTPSALVHSCALWSCLQLLSTAGLSGLVLVFPLSSACGAVSLVSGWTRSPTLAVFSTLSCSSTHPSSAKLCLSSGQPPSSPSTWQQRASLENTSRFPHLSRPTQSLAFLSLSAFTMITSSCLI